MKNDVRMDDEMNECKVQLKVQIIAMKTALLFKLLKSSITEYSINKNECVSKNLI